MIISACLLGEYCRYDGKTKEFSALKEAYSSYEIIPFCPEAPLFGTPRERIAVVSIEGKEKIITEETALDVTSSLSKEINNFCHKHRDIDAIILKSKSPSCGYGTTPIYNQNKEVIKFANGIAANMLEDFYKGVKIQDENYIEKKHFANTSEA